NGTDWEQLFTKQGHGTSFSSITYYDVDDTPTIGVNYYRLSETDFDGVTADLGIRSVTVGQEEEIMIYPNPANELVYLSYDSKNVYEVLVVDMMGRMVWKNEVKSGNSIDVREFEAGMYVLKINGKEYKLLIGAN
ncbi:MAG: T9SS type A sorting domain-containing protein, partial [Flavobacteriia bacterium]|nr:T9SS type A sorting domain-containing protein [Flavobacteriia bacterium]